MRVRGRFITLEGGEGAGKSTQVARLVERLPALTGRPAVGTREPGGSPTAEALRAVLLAPPGGPLDGVTEALLMVAARRDHLRHTILPALDAGHWVVSDRFADSTIAYQGWGRGLERTALDQLNGLALGGITPDLTLILDVDPERGLARARARRTGGQGAGGGGADPFEAADLAFHRRLRQGYRAIAAAEPRRCALVAVGELDPEAVTERLLALIVDRLLG